MERKISASPSTLVRELEELQEATSANLKERWRALYRSETPRRISRDLWAEAVHALTKVAADASARRGRVNC